MLKIYGEPESKHEGACLRCMVDQIAKWGRGVFNTCDEPNRQTRGHVSDVRYTGIIRTCVVTLSRSAFACSANDRCYPIAEKNDGDRPL